MSDFRIAGDEIQGAAYSPGQILESRVPRKPMGEFGRETIRMFRDWFFGAIAVALLAVGAFISMPEPSNKRMAGTVLVIAGLRASPGAHGQGAREVSQILLGIAIGFIAAQILDAAMDRRHWKELHQRVETALRYGRRL